ncbi:transposase [Streptococcus pneumoniae]|nr:transposase [Streptococcus pneumoniae]
MQDNYTTKGKHLTIDSRRLIERWKKEGKSNREIASLLGKAPQTIHTKIKRRTVRKCLGKGRFKEVYSADYAQQSYENNRKHSVKRSSVTKELKEKILHYHNQKFLPEMMVVITTVTGIGNRLGAVILAEIQNIHAFDNPAQLQAFAGLDSSIYQSGQIDLAGRMVKRGSPHLR